MAVLTNRQGRKRNGFTLIEVLVSVVILSTGLVLLLRAFSTSLVAMDASNETVQAALLADHAQGEAEESLRFARLAPSTVSRRYRDGDFAVSVEVRELARLSSLSSTVMSVEVALERQASGHDWVSASCVQVPDR